MTGPAEPAGPEVASPADPDPTPPSVGWLRAAGVATSQTLGRPRLWPIALAGFLLRGGIVLFALPIVVLPTPTGLSNVFAEDVAALALGGPAPATILRLGLLLGLLVAWLVVGTIVGVIAELTLVEAVAGDPEVRSLETSERATSLPPADVDAGLVARAVGVRLVALAPLGLALVWAIPRVVAATYHELILPDELVTPIVLRVLRDAPDAPLVLLASWLLGEAIGAIGVRAVALDGLGVRSALVAATRRLLGRPLTSLLTTGAGLGVGLVAIVPGLAAAAVVWSQLGAALEGTAPAVVILGATALFVAAWAGGLVLASAASAWRAAAWTTEVVRATRARSRRWPVRSRRALGGA